MRGSCRGWQGRELEGPAGHTVGAGQWVAGGEREGAPFSPWPPGEGSKFSNNPETCLRLDRGATGWLPAPRSPAGRIDRGGGASGLRRALGRGGEAAAGQAAINTRQPPAGRPCGRGRPGRDAQAGRGGLSTKAGRRIKSIINILPGKNTKCVFFSEKLITWKGAGRPRCLARAGGWLPSPARAPGPWVPPAAPPPPGELPRPPAQTRGLPR